MLKSTAALCGVLVTFVTAGVLILEARDRGGARSVAPAWAPGARPLAFERNDGQTAACVKFVARAAGGTVFIGAEGATVAPRRGAPLRMRFDRAQASSVEGGGRLPGVVNYLKGRDPAGWHTGIPLFAQTRCRDVWPGVDVAFHGQDGRVEYDFEIAPGAEVESIALRFDGAESARVDPDGSLDVRVAGAQYRHLPPRVFQGVGASRREVDGAFVARGDGRIGFRVARRDPSQALLIDPVVAFATYLGGSDADSAADIAVDAAGSAYLTGAVASVDFPVENPLPGASGTSGGDIFVSKLNASGAKLLFSTYVGGGGSDAGWAVRTDSRGVYVAGSTTSPDFPLVRPVQSLYRGGASEGDAFLVWLSPAGSQILLATYLGGTGDDACRALAVDRDGNLVTGGFTDSADFPVTNDAVQVARKGPSDAWIARIDTKRATVAYSTYVGGTQAPDAVTAIVADPQGGYYASGFTASADFPVSGAAQKSHGGGTLDAFAARFNTAGAMTASTFLGGLGDDASRRMALDASGNVYVAGLSLSPNFPRVAGLSTPGGGSGDPGDGFVAELAGDLSAIRFSSLLGGGSTDDVHGLAVGPGGTIYVSGNTTSANFPSIGGAQAGFGGTRDAFVTKIAASGGSILWSTAFGGAGYEAGTALAVDASGDAYLAVAAAGAGLPEFCAFQPGFGGGPSDVYVVKLTDSASASPSPPAGLTVSVASAYRIDLAWTDASRNECAFRVERRSGDGAWLPIASLDTNTTAFSDPAVEPGRTYAYRVIAVNPLGESAPSAEVTVSSPETIVLSQRSGRLRESAAKRGDLLQVRTLLRFSVQSGDHTVHPLQEAFEIAVGAQDDPVPISIPANDPRWVRTSEKRFRWQNSGKARPRVRVDLDLATLTLTLKLTRLDFPTTPAGAIYLSMRAGDDAGQVTRTWTSVRTRPGQFRLP